MASIQEKAQAMLWYAEFKSMVMGQNRFRHAYAKAAPDANRIKACHSQFLKT